MAGFYRCLFRRAREVAEAAAQQTERLKKEIEAAEKRKAEIEAEFELAKLAVDRLDGFEPEIGGDPQCPDCWVSRGVRSRMIPIPSETGTDWFRCRTCGQEIAID